MKNAIAVMFLFLIAGCASITNDSHVPVSLSFSDGSNGSCNLENKRWTGTLIMPGVASVRRSDDVLKFTCKTSDGRDSFGSIPSTMGAKIIASAVFLDLGIVDSITDMHREYPASFVIPVKKVN
jgi:hypothetical protein